MAVIVLVGVEFSTSLGTISSEVLFDGVMVTVYPSTSYWAQPAYNKDIRIIVRVMIVVIVFLCDMFFPLFLTDL